MRQDLKTGDRGGSDEFRTVGTRWKGAPICRTSLRELGARAALACCARRTAGASVRAASRLIARSVSARQEIDPVFEGSRQLNSSGKQSEKEGSAEWRRRKAGFPMPVRIKESRWIGSAKGPELTTCPHCGEVIMNYRACGECGYYRGRKVMETAADAKAKE